MSSPSTVDGSGDDTSPQRKQSKKPKYSRFTQQELPACKPLLTPGIVIGIFTLISFVFIPIGLATLFASESVVEVVDRYDADCVPSDMHGKELDFIQNTATNKTCTRKLIIPKTMKSPVHVYYELDNFYQNHRRYVKSRSDKQLLQPSSEGETKVCAPEGTTSDGKPIVPCGLIAWSLFNDTYAFSANSLAIQVNKKNIAWASDRSHKFGKDVYPKNFQKSALIGGGTLNETIPTSLPNLCGTTPDGKPIVPCGLIAWSLFNDTYAFFSANSLAIQVNKKNIAWASDQSHKFGKDVFPKNFQKSALIGGGTLNETIPLSEQEDLIVWMRTAALPNFRKLYGRIEEDLLANEEITVVIENNYNTYSFGGKKKLVLSTATWIGGKNSFLGVAYLTVGGLCLSLALAFFVLYLIKPRTLGDPSYLSWNRNPTAFTD